jgi:hypothetical protein
VERVFAETIRASMNYAREPENLRRILALHSQMFKRPGLIPDYVNLHSPDTTIFVNALHKYVSLALRNWDVFMYMLPTGFRC